MKFSRTFKVAAAAVLALSSLTMTGAPADASTGPVPKPKPISWTIGFGTFGQHKVNETVATAHKISKIDYTKLIKDSQYKKKGIHCSGPLLLPLVKSGVHKQNVWAIADVPCDNNVRTYASYVKKYKPYSKTRLTAFYSSASRWNGDFVPNYAYGKYLPHTKKVAIGDTFRDIVRAYPHNNVDLTHLSVSEVTSDGTAIYDGPVIVYKDHSQAAKQRGIVFHLSHNSIDSIATSYISAYMLQ